MTIRRLDPDGVAAQAGLLAGDDILTINGHRMVDVLDYRFHDQDDFVALEVQRGAERFLFEIEKEAHDSLGIELDDLKISRCGNDCIFCFVDQNPAGLREAVYFRDGDYRFSFLHGNFVTLTNVGPKGLDRIVRLRMSPIYVSVHSTDAAVRLRLMGMKKDDALLEKMRFLHDGGIEMHTQIVLCPGINDGASLEKTVADLWTLRKTVRSLSIVPVGLTDHRAALHRIRTVDAQYAAELLRLVARWQKERFLPALGKRWMYPSDEFFIVAGKKLPGGAYYDGFGQVENGVGLSRKFLEDFRRAARRFPERIGPRRVSLATGILAEGFMRESVLPRLNAVEGLSAELHPIENRLFGSAVTVAGLLSGKCFLEALRGKNLGDLLLLPPDTLNYDGIFLDDTDPRWLGDRLGVPVMVFDGRWKKVMEVLSGRVPPERLEREKAMNYLDHTRFGLKEK